jgi:transcriptional regulator with XRE-family HTH domain
MSIAPDHFSSMPIVACPAAAPTGDDKESKSEPKSNRPLNRIAEVRREQGVSHRSAARQLGTDVATVRQQERPDADLRLSELLKWQQALDVPLIDLLEDPAPPLSRPVMERARMIRLMKTAAAIQEQSDRSGVQRLAEMLVDQLVEIMPELAEVNAWHSVGQRRSLNECGRIVERCVRDDFFQTHQDD